MTWIDKMSSRDYQTNPLLEHAVFDSAGDFGGLTLVRRDDGLLTHLSDGVNELAVYRAGDGTACFSAFGENNPSKIFSAIKSKFGVVVCTESRDEDVGLKP
jgi:hypothetical protein